MPEASQIHCPNLSCGGFIDVPPLAPGESADLACLACGAKVTVTAHPE